jgi:hypothetical protein
VLRQLKYALTNEILRRTSHVGELTMADAVSPTVEPRLDYLMTLLAELDPPQLVGEATRIVNVTGGWVKGPRISGKIIGPAGDWLRALPTGGRRIDARLTIVTDDNQLIYTSYNGIIKHSDASAEKAARGEVVRPADGVYFVAAPTYHTSSERYAWINDIQAIALMTEVKPSAPGRYVKYDVFTVHCA